MQAEMEPRLPWPRDIVVEPTLPISKKKVRNEEPAKVSYGKEDPKLVGERQLICGFRDSF